MASRTEQLEREAEETRADLASTLDQLRSRMTAGQLVDQAVDYMRKGDAAAMVGNLRRQVVQNPLALGLVGAGLAWLMIPHRAASRRAVEPGTGQSTSGRLIMAGGAAADRVTAATSSGMDTISATGRQATGRVTAAGQQVADSAASAATAVSEGYGKLAHGASGAATQVGHSVSSFGRSVAETTGSAGQNFVQMCKDQPLILAGLGLAIGAAIGASLPRTESEDRLMGEASDDLKESAHGFADEKMEEAKGALQDAAAELEDETRTATDSAVEFGQVQSESFTETPSDNSRVSSDSPAAPSIIPLPDQTSPGHVKPASWEPAHGER